MMEGWGERWLVSEWLSHFMGLCVRLLSYLLNGMAHFQNRLRLEMSGLQFPTGVQFPSSSAAFGVNWNISKP